MASKQETLRMQRFFTKEGISPYDEVTWETRTATVGRPGEDPVFEQEGVEVPDFWSQQATNIVAQKYFAYGMDDPRREYSVRQMIDRVVETIAKAGVDKGYFDKEERAIFSDELRYILLHQLAAFNSPVWFNVGVEGAKPQTSACFILAVDDSLESIAQWYTEEMKIFQRGSGAGVNVSKLRSSNEALTLGGFSSGPVTFMRAADASAGTIQSGGTTRRAAKMVVMDIDHPDVEDFIWCKAREEDRIRALRAAGFAMDIDGGAGERNMAEATSYQNANNSVRLSDEFLKAVEEDADWELTARRDGTTVKTVPARELMRQISEAAWRCADPGVQYDTTINDWHTTPAQGPITASNPCSEYMSNDNSACNLASLNLLRFLSDEDQFDVEAFAHTARIIFTAQEITIAFGHFPTRKIARNTRQLRQIGIGFANLGALLMAMGLPYDSDEGRDLAGAITALLTGESYLQSTYLAERIEPFHHFEENRDSVLRVLAKHRSAARKLTKVSDSARPIVRAARAAWEETIKRAEKVGLRNSQASVLAPTGTIAFLMDCDTTGIEPDFSLIKYKSLSGGGSMTIVNQTVPRALRRLGYDHEQIEEIISYLTEEIDKGGGFEGPRGSVVGAPHLEEDHYSVFDCAIGERAIAPMGHVYMMSACQPFLSGAISKTINMPESASIEEIEEVYLEGGKLGLKAIAVYRDNCKAFQPLGDAKKKIERDEEAEEAVEQRITSLLGDGLIRGERRRVPREAEVIGIHFTVAQTSGYIHARLFDDGRPGAIFIDVGQAGSTLRGFINALAITMSVALQHGTPLDIIVSKLANMQFEPYGITDDPEIRQARSLVDYFVKWMAAQFLDPSVHPELGINISDQAIPDSGELAPAVNVHAPTVPIEKEYQDQVKLTASSNPLCTTCGTLMVKTGSCYTCPACGTSGGCG